MQKRRYAHRDRFTLAAPRFGAVALVYGVAMALGAWAHPHVGIEASQSFVFDSEGLERIESTWCFDALASADYVAVHDADGDGALSAEELERLAVEMTGNIRGDGYFTVLEINGKRRATKRVVDPEARLDGSNVVLSFSFPCRLEAGAGGVELRIAQYDPSYFVAFKLASPAYRFEGADAFEAEVEARRKTESAYYGGAVVPEELVLRFGTEAGAQEEAGAAMALGADADGAGVAPAEAEKTDDRVGSSEPAETPASVNQEEKAPGVRARLLGWLVARQEALIGRLDGYLTERPGGALRPSSVAMLCLIALAYGALHSAGPGHGKFVTAGYMAGENRRFLPGIVLGSLIAVFHGLSGVVTVLVGRYLLEKTAMAAVGGVERPLKVVSFALIALLGAAMVVLAVFRRSEPPEAYLCTEEELAAERRRSLREVVFLALATGCVPCPAVVLIMLFCSAAGHTVLGVALSLCTVLGMALTICGIGVAAGQTKRLACGFAGGQRRSSRRIERYFRVASGSVLFLFGALCLVLVQFG